MKVTLFTAISADGFISDDSANNYWISDRYQQNLKDLAYKIKNVVAGRITYQKMLKSNDLEVDHVRYHVLTNSPDNETQFRRPQQILDFLEGQGADEVLLLGGGETNTAFLKAKLIDEVILTVHPVFLGDGVKLFDNDIYKTELDKTDVTELTDDLIQVTFRVKY